MFRSTLFVIALAWGLTPAGRLHAASQNYSIVVYCTSSGQLCKPAYSTGITVANTSQVTLDFTPGPLTCSDFRLHIYLDGSPKVISAFVGPSGDTGPISLGAVGTGMHMLAVQAEGEVSGCNPGSLLSWGGNLQVSQILLPHGSAPGIFRSSTGYWLLDTNFDDVFDQGDQTPYFAGSGLTPEPADIAVVGDWLGDGTTKIGLYRPSSGTWFLDYNGNGMFDGPSIDRQYQYGGVPGDVPVVGDWSGTGYDKIGIFREGGFWLLNMTGTGALSQSDAFFPFGGLTGCPGLLPGVYSREPAGSCDIPVVGDWNRTGTIKVGIVRAAPGTSQPFLWILDTTGAQVYIPSGPNPSTVFAFGGIQGDVPIVGDWNNAGQTNVGVFRQGFYWVENATTNMPSVPAVSDNLLAFPYGGITGDQPVVGRWP